MAPPTKRRKRNNGYISSTSPSEDDGSAEETQSKSKSTIMDLISSSPIASSEKQTTASSSLSARARPNSARPQPRATTANFPPNAAPIYLPKARSRTGSKSASTSPEKTRQKAKVDEKGKSGNIFALFSKQALRQKADAKEPPSSRSISATQSSKSADADEFDGISDDDNVFTSLAQPSSLVSQAARKRLRGSQTLKNDEGELPTPTQKFLVTAQNSTKSRPEDTRPWAERFAPQSLEELAVHKKKVSDVRDWLTEVITGRRRQRVLLLKGAAGTGKTTTVQLLADAIGCEVLEWRNPVGSVDTSDGVQSMTAQFEEFLGRSGKFGQLDIMSQGAPIVPKPDNKPLDRRKKLIVVEEFPNTFSRSSTALQSFRGTILQYLAANTPPLSLNFDASSKESITPVILIVSENLLTTTSAAADSFTAHRLLGPEILQHPGVGIIEFNPIAPTLLAKALEVIVQKESRRSGRRKTPGPLVLKALGEVGDIRSAVGSLEFLCLRGDLDGDWGSKVAFGKAKRGKEQALTRMEEESLELVTRREASLGIFHAVAKVVYNKRVDADALPSTTNNETLPGFLSMQSRPKKSTIDVERLIDETGTDTQTFIAALHENYILSCDAPATSFEVSSLDHVNGCIESLSDSDLLCPSWDGSFNSTGFGGGTGGRGSGGDILRQDEITFQIAVRGLLFALPNPVTRRAPDTGGIRKMRGGDQFKMFYPTSLRLWRTQEDIESTIDLWVTRMMKGEDHYLRPVTSGAAAFSRPKAGTVESWKAPPKNLVEKDDDTAPLLAVGTSARKEMLLERLPYMLQIARPRKQAHSALAIKDMEKVVTFHGIGGPAADDEADGEGDDNDAAGEEWATDKPSERKSPKKKGLVMRGRGQTAAVPMQKEQELKLVLSDDDIEDD